MKQFLTVLESLVTLILVVVAIAGISFHTFRDNGWLSQGFGKIADAYINYPLIALAITIALFFAYRSWHGRKEKGSGQKFFDNIVYVMMAIGIYFIGRFVLKGEF